MAYSGAAMAPPAHHIVRFEEFELDRQTLELRRAGTPVRLQQQPARVLALLVERAGDLVTRESLRQAVWGDETFVDFDRGLNYCISQIRNALGDSAEAPRLLETLRGRGYRFVGRIEVARASGGRAVALRALAAVAALLLLVAAGFWGVGRIRAARSGERAAIGVAALVAPSGERPWAEALRAQIVSRLSAASRTPVIDLEQDLASGRSTRWRLEGRVDRSVGQLRVTMFLRDMHDGSVPWSDVFAGAPGDWVDAQSEMADRMTEIIRYRIEGPSAGAPMRRAKLPPRAPVAP